MKFYLRLVDSTIWTPANDRYMPPEVFDFVEIQQAPFLWVFRKWVTTGRRWVFSLPSLHKEITAETAKRMDNARQAKNRRQA